MMMETSPGAPASVRPSISLVFPVYNDGHAINGLTEKGVRILSELASDFEIVIVNDGSRDESGAVADELARRFEMVRVIHHPTNLGYGAALKTAFTQASGMDWICFTDGDHQYDISEIRHFAKLLAGYDMIIGFRVCKTYGWFRRFLSFGLNALVGLAFGTRFRDITCGFKMVRREVMEEIHVTSHSPFAGGEVAVRAALKGYRVGESAISMYPRQIGRSSIVSWRSIRATFADVMRVRRDIFRNRPRGE